MYIGNMRYFKIVYGYNQDDYIEIIGDELTKAVALFLEGSGKGVFENGMVRGQDILRIIPNWNKEFGYNKGYKMTPDDYGSIPKQLEQAYSKAYEIAKDIVKYAIENVKQELISMPATKALEQLPFLLDNKSLSESIKILHEKK